MKMREKRIEAALGNVPADLVLKNAKVINVLSGEIVPGDIAIVDGVVAGVGCYDSAREVVDLGGKYVSPGFINAHCHVESSMVTPAAYCREELRWGTTTLITDPHEIANVAGADGVRYMLEASEGLPIDYYVQLPSCVPATPFENAGDVFTADKMKPFLSHPRVLGLGEMMDYPGVLSRSGQVMEKLDLWQGRVVDGHAPAVTGRALQAYVGAGIQTDHESTTFEEALEKLRAGMAVLVREGSASKNLDAVLTGFIHRELDTRSLAFCTDDKHIAAIRREGTVRHCVRRAIALGLAPVTAYQMATVNAARIYRLWDLGAVAPGCRADLLVLDDLEQVRVAQVYKDGKLVRLEQVPPQKGAEAGRGSVNIAPPRPDSLELPAYKAGVLPVIRVLPGQITTRMDAIPRGDALAMLASGALCKVAVLERHHATGNVGVGLLAGYGLKNGAIASTVGHDSHNLIVVGGSDEDMLLAVEETRRIQGGYVLVQKGKVAGTVPLPVYGLMSADDPEVFIKNLDAVIELAHRAGVPRDMDPFITLSFLALPVLPEIRVTDLGLFDVARFSFFSSGR